MLPQRLWWRPEAGGGVVQGAQELADLPDLLVGVGVRVRDPSLDVGQDLPALVVVAVTHDAGRGGEAALLQVPEQGVHGRCPGPGRAQDRVAVADGRGGLPVGPGQGCKGNLR